jgi:hypothetical protein
MIFNAAIAIRTMRSSVGLAAGMRGHQMYARSLTGIAEGSMGSSWKNRERAAEEIYFNKEDAATLSKLAAKLHKATEVSLPRALCCFATLLPMLCSSSHVCN